jgi:hypothetical protein
MYGRHHETSIHARNPQRFTIRVRAAFSGDPRALAVKQGPARMDDETLRLISERQDRMEGWFLRFEARYSADQEKQEEWRTAVDRQLAMVPLMTESFKRMAQLAAGTIVTIITMAISVIVFGGPS